MSSLDAALAPVLAHLDAAAPGEPLGVYLYGSATAGGLRPQSDLDVLLVTRRSLDDAERDAVAAVLLDASGRYPRLHAGAARPLELTSVVLGDVRPWRDPPRRDLQFGEWLRDDLAAGARLLPEDDPDVPILLAAAQSSHRVLRGAPLESLVDPVPPALVRDGMLGSVPDILEEIVGDERDTLLVFARMLVTLRTGCIVAKDAAATVVASELDAGDRELMERARDGYLGVAADDWSGAAERVEALVRRLAADVERAGRAQVTER